MCSIMLYDTTVHPPIFNVSSTHRIMLYNEYIKINHQGTRAPALKGVGPGAPGFWLSPLTPISMSHMSPKSTRSSTRSLFSFWDSCGVEGFYTTVSYCPLPWYTQRLPNSRRGSWRSLRPVRQSASDALGFGEAHRAPRAATPTNKAAEAHPGEPARS